MSETIVAPEQRDLRELEHLLANWIRSKLPAKSDARVGNLEYPRGAGQSHETILFDAVWQEGGAEHSRGYVLRIKPSRFTIYPDDLFVEQFKIMHVLHEAGTVPVARPMWLEEDPAVLGSPFFIMEKVTGRVPVSVPPYARTGWVADATPAERRTLWEEGVRHLAAIQSAPLEKLGFLAGPPHAPHGLEQEFDKYSRMVAWVQEHRACPVLDRALVRLRETWPQNRAAGLTWGDARLGNMMFNRNFEVIAVMDWEQPSLGGALNDLAWWIVNAEVMHGARDGFPHLDGMGTKAETVALWEQLTGHSAENLDWYEDFTHLKFSCLSTRMSDLRGLPRHSEEGMARRLKVT